MGTLIDVPRKYSLDYVRDESKAVQKSQDIFSQEFRNI
jgi:hypothetical protein